MKETLRISGRTFFAAVIALVLVLVLASMWIFGWGFVSRTTADYRGGTDATEQVHADGGYRIAAYEYFYDLCAAVQTKEDEIGFQESELDTKPSASRAEQIQSNLTALRNKRAELINEYNAESAKADTKANFKASDLPFRLDVDAKETKCAA